MTAHAPLLTIAIPTWNRASYLALNLTQLGRQLPGVAAGSVEILVSNNASQDNTASVVEEAIAAGTPVRYVGNTENIGSDANIAQCFNLARGKYVLILGDDDLLVDGALARLLDQMQGHNHGVITLRPYGYDDDFRREYPGGAGRARSFADPAKFLAAIGPLMALISACVINKSLLPHIDARQFCGGSLVQVHLVLLAATAAKENLYLYRYLIAYKRNNWGAYDFAAILVTSLTQVLDRHKDAVTPGGIAHIERRMLMGYYPFYVFCQRLKRSGDLPATRAHFEKRFKGRFLYEAGVAPILTWPRPLALVWGAMVTLGGRALTGDLRRGIMFAFHKMRPKRAAPVQTKAAI